jgi:hypothetical protein
MTVGRALTRQPRPDRMCPHARMKWCPNSSDPQSRKAGHEGHLNRLLEALSQRNDVQGRHGLVVYMLEVPTHLRSSDRHP